MAKRIYVCSRCGNKYLAGQGANDGNNKHVCGKCLDRGWAEIKDKLIKGG
jgi:hypothetical protein